MRKQLSASIHSLLIQCLKRQTLTLTPVSPGLPGGPSFPFRPVSPFSPLSPSWPISPLSPWECANTTLHKLENKWLQFMLLPGLCLDPSNKNMRGGLESTSPWLHQDQLGQLLPLSQVLPVITHTFKLNYSRSHAYYGFGIFTRCPISPCSPMFPACPMSPWHKCKHHDFTVSMWDMQCLILTLSIDIMPHLLSWLAW